MMSQQRSMTSRHNKNTIRILRGWSYNVMILGRLRGVAHLIRKLQRAVARRASARSRAPAELLRHPLQPELQHDLLSLQLKNTFLQVPDHILESLDDYPVPVHTALHRGELAIDAILQNCNLLLFSVKAMTLMVEELVSLLLPAHESVDMFWVVLVHHSNKMSLDFARSLQSLPLSSLLAFLQTGKAGKS